MKSLIYTLITLFFMSTSMSTNAGFPVTDFSNLIESLRRFEQMRQELKRQEQILKNATGARDLSYIIDTVYDITLDVIPEDILSEFYIDSSEEFNLPAETARIYDIGNENAAINLGQSRLSLDQAKMRFFELKKLIDKVNTSAEQKDILDLNARVGAEISMLSNEMSKLESIRQENEAKERIRKQQIVNELLKSSGELPTF